MKKALLAVGIAVFGLAATFAKDPKAPKPPKHERAQMELMYAQNIPEDVVKEYHAAQIEALTILANAEVKAGILTQEQADAKIAMFTAVQSTCQGQCIVAGKTDMKFDNKMFRNPSKPPRWGQQPPAPRWWRQNPNAVPAPNTPPAPAQ